jgi:hypothetical protein
MIPPRAKTGTLKLRIRPDPLASHLQICKKLRFVNWKNVLNTLDLKDQNVFYDQVEPIPTI